MEGWGWGGAVGGSSLFGQDLNNTAPEIKMLVRGGSQASPPAYLLSTQTPQPHPGREDRGKAGSMIRHPAQFPKISSLESRVSQLLACL